MVQGPASQKIRFSVDEKGGDDELDSKRIKLMDSYQEVEGQNASESSPLGLSLKKSPSFLDLIEMKLSQGRKLSRKEEDSEKDSAKSEEISALRNAEKLKASNFPANLLKIGTWERLSIYEGDLVSKCYYAKRKLVWEVLESGLKSKIEIQWSDISAIRAIFRKNEADILEIELCRAPMFFKETDPQPRKHTLWQTTSDFTGGQAPIYRRHYVEFPEGTLERHYEKLLQCDSRLLLLSKKPFPALNSPYFFSNLYGNSDFSFGGGFNEHLLSPFPLNIHRTNAMPLHQLQNFERVRPSFNLNDSTSLMSVMKFPHNVRQQHDQKAPFWVEGISNDQNLYSRKEEQVPLIHSTMQETSLISQHQVYNHQVLNDIADHLLNDPFATSVISDEQRVLTKVKSMCNILDASKEPIQTWISTEYFNNGMKPRSYGVEDYRRNNYIMVRNMDESIGGSDSWLPTQGNNETPLMNLTRWPSFPTYMDPSILEDSTCADPVNDPVNDPANEVNPCPAIVDPLIILPTNSSIQRGVSLTPWKSSFLGLGTDSIAGFPQIMALRKYVPAGDVPSVNMAPSKFLNKVHEKAQYAEAETAAGPPVEADVDIDLKEVYFLIMHFLSAGPCHRTYGQFWNELLEHQLLPRRFHAWYSRTGKRSGDENDNGLSFPLSYNKLVERYPHIEKDHLVKLLKQLILNTAPSLHGMIGGKAPNAADVPTLLGSGSFSLLESHRSNDKQIKCLPSYLRWPHMQADQVRGLGLREIGGGFTKQHRSPSIRAACYAIAKPLTMVQKMQNIKKLRGHRNAVYCATFDCTGRYVITGSDDRLVKIWSMETAFCLASCRGHEGDITDLAVSLNNALVASSSNDFVIRVWRLPDGLPISVLRGHTSVVTAIVFSPKPSSVYQLLSSSDDGTCRIWDARYSNFTPRVYLPRPVDVTAGKSNVPSSSTGPQRHQILCCAFNANGTVFVTGSSDTLARVWNACKSNTEDSDQPHNEMDVLSGHENDVNYVQFSGCAVPSRSSTTDACKEENVPKLKNSWFTHDNIVTCSRDGSAIIWIPRSRRSHGKIGRWTRAYHLKVPPPPMPPQPPRRVPRQRFLPTPRGVNMIVWSLDNHFVLAAIMDCRICVWNAADGSLVHSLTGHTESTYVLDVHPFNPRMAMSAGYDGKTIVWDIWEGTPIRIYETGRFKLVDGKFSPDGTSIVLSDDVGQIYILNTGQGESQKDAKYDQFFLGDYRPLMQDTHGNVLDQETQLAPYRRNMQDLLCDSSMIPYPEPYQSMYQRRRLGALGLEWRPPSVRYAVGADTSLGLQDYQMLPLVDLDRMFDPLPEFIDVMDWEPENEIQSDDTDSEYNVTEEYSSEGEQGSLGTGSSSDPECSGEDSEVKHSHKDNLRRSKRKKHKEVEFMTSSGRRVKRRNLDERDGTLSRTNRAKKSRNGWKALKRKSSTSKSSRPRRVAARNALNLFSRITEASTDGEDEDGSEGDSSDSESMNTQGYESDRSIQNGQQKHHREKESFLNETEGMFKTSEVPDSVKNTGNRKRLVLKFSKKSVEGTSSDFENLVNLVGSSSRNPPKTIKACVGFEDPGSSSGHAIDTVQSQNCNGSQIRERALFERSEDHLDLPAGYKDNKIRWGEVKARTSKHLRLGIPTDACSRSIVSHDGHKELESVDEHKKPENKQEMASPRASEGLDGARNEELSPELAHEFGLFKPSSPDELPRRRIASPLNCNGYVNRETDDQSQLRECKDYGNLATDDKIESSCFKNGTIHPEEVKEKPSLSSTKLRIRTKRSSMEPESPSKQNPVTSTEDWRNSACELMFRSPSPMEQNLISGVPDEDEGTSGHITDQGELNRLEKSKALIDKGLSSSAFHDLKGLHSYSNNKICHVVYKRSKSCKSRLDSEGDGGAMGESSNASNHNLDLRMDFPADAPNGPYRTRSMGMNATVRETNTLKDNLRVREGYGLTETSKSADKFDRNTQLLCEEWRSNSKMPVGLRSARNRRGNYNVGDMNTLDKRKSHRSVGKFSWLMLTEHEEGYRYIPQLGDEIIYLRQGHQEFMEMSNSVEVGPWKAMKRNVRAVELCKVKELDYSTLAGSGESCCKITLEVIDPTSSVFGRTFKLTLPELNDFPDFMVERTRYDAAIKRNWTHRDKCQVYWREENEEGGSWWEGRILAVKPKSSEFPDSPWERFVVSYKSDSTGQHLHCPWELHDPDIQWEHPRIDGQTREKLLTSFTKLEQSANRKEDYYGIQKLKQVGQKSDYLNRFPVPLSLKVVQQRLQDNYYRSLEAMKHDVSVMLSNAQSYFAKNVEISTKLKLLSDWFSRKFSSF
ncbi:hypothetical protein NE237_013281 [Protea cynaroides]|uniref:Bromo domain-containing protein n=1 Tax=Protea cynaroides TaxID=273540 RepID=A0A9Q0H1E6_9MAGN|nr:hypothetical protein NE237_013281 [Protea cynaroides]